MLLQVDGHGVPRVLERDDHEATLLGAMIKSGSWLVPEVAAARLDMELEGQPTEHKLGKQYLARITKPPVADAVADDVLAMATAATNDSSDHCQQDQQRHHLPQQQQLGQCQQQPYGQQRLPPGQQQQQQNLQQQRLQRPLMAQPMQQLGVQLLQQQCDCQPQLQQQTQVLRHQQYQQLQQQHLQQQPLQQAQQDSCQNQRRQLSIHSQQQAVFAAESRKSSDSSNSSNDLQDGGDDGSGPMVAAASAVPLDAVKVGTATQAVLKAKYDNVVKHVVLRLKGGKLLARVCIDTTTWHVVGYCQPLCSESEVWQYHNWTNWSQVREAQSRSGSLYHSSPPPPLTSDVYHPERVVHVLFPGSEHVYTTHGALVRGNSVHRAYQLPSVPPVPVDAHFRESCSAVPVWQSQGGHLLTLAYINDQRAGYMLLDTGASGFVIETKVAEQFRLSVFGNLRVASVGGKLKTRYRRAKKLRIGPLEMTDPILMEMNLGGLVSGFHDRIIGIAGYDVFRRCRIVLPSFQTRAALVKATSDRGKVKPTPPTAVAAGNSSSSDTATSLDWPPKLAAVRQLQQLQEVQQDVVSAKHAAEAGHTAAAAAGAAAAGMQASSAGTVVQPPSRRSRHSTARTAAAAASSSGSSSSAGSISHSLGTPQQLQGSNALNRSRRSRLPATVAQSVVAMPLETGASTGTNDTDNSSSSDCLMLYAESCDPQQQSAGPTQSSMQYIVPPRPSGAHLGDGLWSNYLIEVMLQRPHIVTSSQELEKGYVWQDLHMIASLPHVELEFVIPATGRRVKSLFMVDTGAGGTEVMFHSRATRELGLVEKENAGKAAEASADWVHGVGEASKGKQHRVAVKSGKLPEMVVRGQGGSNLCTKAMLALQDVRAVFCKSGGLDISLYSAGMVCVDLLSRTQVVLDYPNKKIGWKVPAAQPASVQQVDDSGSLCTCVALQVQAAQ
eukprot:GHRR01012988.1.p1 GENE.GHRR01012988.1~~GHRR01012988.1.p1  ORF type:complete len:950 (+),score=433.73 GHRR01012988.1:1099-3948(+)